MLNTHTTRAFATAVGTLCLLGCAVAQQGPPRPGPYGGDRPNGQQQGGQRMGGPGAGQRQRQQDNQGTVPRGQHLGQWMQQHRNLNPQQQQRALQGESGFSQLPPQTQQRMMDRLNRLNTMPEQKRDRVLRWGETMERYSPQQKIDVRSAMGQLSSLPQDRRRMVARSFRELRSLSPQERNAALNSPQYRQQFNDEERGTLGNLLSVGPLLPDSR